MEIETLHVPFAKFLREEKIPFDRARWDAKSTITEGHPDFTIYWNGHCLFIEFKTKEGTVKPAQLARHEELRAAGMLVLVCRELQFAIDATHAWIGRLGEAKPINAAKPAEKLIQFGGWLCREQNGELIKVRKAA